MEMYYNYLFDISLILSLVFVFMWHKHFDVHFTLIFAFIPIANMGYMMIGNAESLEEIIMGIKVSYIGGCYLTLFIMMCVFDRCKISLKRWVRISLMLLTAIVYSTVLTVGKYPVFYKSISFEKINGINILHKEYGPMHTVFMILVGVLIVASIWAVVYTLIKKKDVSAKTIRLVFLPEMVCAFSFFLGRRITNKIDLIPLGYVFSQVVYLILADRLCLYDIDAINADSIMQAGYKGFVSFDFRKHYLGCNDTALKFMPELKDIKVDSHMRKSGFFKETALKWIEEFRNNERKSKFFYRRDDRVYLVDIDYLFDGKKKRGYCLSITDDTKNQNYIDLINRFNGKLRDEVEEKTNHLIEMHNKLIMGMAAMVESRDNSTGGHIKRTSECVRILIDEILKKDELELTEEFCKNIIKAAPMHDLGKIAVDDAILRKKGRFEPWEYEKMKLHAPEGAKIIREILKDTDDEAFRKIAINVANYHHERWDGSGYPEGLKGEDIPLEARIMAIADVYDALVSKRVYKDSMSFEEANRIIMLGMGNQFDESLKQYYISARPKLEKYYKSLEGAS